MANNLDNLDSQSFSDELIPFQFRKEKDMDGTLRWLKAWFEWEYEKAYPRYVMYRRYINMYKNLEEDSGDGMMRTAGKASNAKKSKIRDNIVFSNTEQRVSQVGRKKIALSFIPRVQNSQQDINATKATKMLIRGRHEAIDFDGQMTRFDRTTYLLGHALYEICWDKNDGPLAPAYERAKAKFAEGIPVIDENTGLPVQGKKLDKAIKIGDVKGKLWQPYQWFAEPGKARLKPDCDYINTFDWETKQLIENRYPKAEDKLSASEFMKWDFSSDRLDKPSNQIMIHTFWHKPTEFFPEGCKIVWCDDMILEWEDFPYEHGELPFEDEKDIEVEGEFWGRPYITNIEQFYKINNSLITGMARNHGVLSAPKVMAPEGSIDVSSLHNEFGTLFYRGPVKPEVLQHQYVNTGEMEFQKYCQSRAGDLAGIYDISRGVVPNGITAASAIRYLDEQELQRATPSIAKRNKRILNIVRMEVKTMAQYYKDTDERTVRYVGENNEHVIKSFKKLSLNAIADVRMENTSAIGDTKTGAIADIIDLNAANQKNPVFGPKEIVKILDLGLDDAFKDEMSYAVDTGRTILELLLDGEQVPPPAKTDGLMEFYSIFSRFVESMTYKTKLDEQTKQAVNDYIMAIEMLMWQMSVENMKFGMMLQAFEKFPMFFSAPQPPQPMTPPGQEQPQGQPGAGAPQMDMNALEFQKQGIEQEIKNQGDI